MAQANRSIVIDVDPDFFYDIICDFMSYPEFIDEVHDTRIEKEGKDEWTVTTFVKIIKKIDYTLNLKGVRGKSLTWSLAKKGFMKKNDGSWTLKDLGNNQIEATYSAEIDLGLLAPKTIVNAVMSTNFPTMLKAFKKRAEGLYAQK